MMSKCVGSPSATRGAAVPFIALLLALVTSLATAQDAQANRWPVAEPASVGLSLTVLTEIHEDILAGQYGHVDSFLLARQGRIVFEQYYEHDYRDIYRREASQPGALVVNDPSGPYLRQTRPAPKRKM